jgi:hypothetical protein
MIWAQSLLRRGIQQASFISDGYRRGSEVQGITENFDVINGIILVEAVTPLWCTAGPIMSVVWSPG